MLGYLWKLLVTLAYELGVTDVLGSLARLVFTVPAMPAVPKIPGFLGRVHPLQASFEASCREWSEVPFWAGVGQGFAFGFVAGVLAVVLVLFKANVITLGKKL